jgi:outer membrane protein assembly factor BamD (BamD/ComL family)
MAAVWRITIVGMLLVLLAPGCATAPKSTAYAPQPLTQEQADWWAANQHRKVYVAGRGYYVEGVNGFFDQDGRKLPSDNSPMVSADEEQGFIERISPKNTVKKIKVAMGAGPDEKVARAALEEGDSLFRQKAYMKAADKYKIAYKRWPDSPLEEEAIFKAGECHFFADRYSKAEDDYGLLIKKFPSSQYVSMVVMRRFTIGRYWEQCDEHHHHYALTPNWFDKTRPFLDTMGNALKVYERIRLDDPTGPLADDAVMAAANAHFIRGHWEEADYHFGLLRTEFPKSEFQFKAHLLGLRCKLLRYQGPGYEGAPLDEAEELATQLLTQFSQELGDERDRVLQVRASVRDQRALREWDTAEYYAKGKYYGAAKYYYAKVVRDYQDTKLAQEAQGRIDKYKIEPDKPEKPFQWLVNILPQSTREGPVLPKELRAKATPPPAATVASEPNTTTTTQ